MARHWQRTRKTFRHGDLPETLVAAASEQLEADGVDAVSLRELARDAGVNHRAVYRHFPDKDALLARVTQQGWRDLALRVSRAARGKTPGEARLVAESLGFFRFARAHPNLFHLMAGPRMNMKSEYPALEAALSNALKIFMAEFIALGMAPEIAIARTAVFVAALSGIMSQILYKRLHIAPAKAPGFIADTCKMLVKGLR